MNPGSPRSRVLEQIADSILSKNLPHPIRVAVDGIDAAGKSFLGDELADTLTRRGVPVIRSSIDYFHFPRQHRQHQHGPDSPLGYYEDSFNYALARQWLLDPLGPGGSRVYRARSFDFQTDSAILSPQVVAPVEAVLIFDGIFLLRPELIDCWDLKIFLDIPFDLSVQRASQRQRDQELFGEAEQVAQRYRQRYVPGQKIYFERCQPKEQADIIVDNQNLAAPTITGGRYFYRF